MKLRTILLSLLVAVPALAAGADVVADCFCGSSCPCSTACGC
ncbi:MAG: hypothetical protein Q8O67_33150 [Deltaproteobacteria bacterium]|nr:hypothetical protein [Deltaproteobacteria bacterium]